jgi:hypothetical protein
LEEVFEPGFREHALDDAVDGLLFFVPGQLYELQLF